MAICDLYSRRKKMKTILFVSPTGTFDNGAEISIFNLMKYLVSEGNKVINIAPVAGAVTENDYSKKCKENGIDCFLLQTQRWWWEEAPGQLFGTAEQRAVSYRETVKFIQKKIEDQGVEIVITNTVNTFQGALAAALVSIPHIWLIHEFPENEFSYYLEKTDFIDTFSSEIFSVTGKLNERLNELFSPRKVHQFSPYTELKSCSLLSGKKQRIVCIGRITERKNQLELIQAYEKLNRSELELVFIGAWDDAYYKKCKEYIGKNKLRGISFMGNSEAPWKLVTDLDICVFPSSMETFGLVYVESLLNGVPVILSDNPGHTSAYELFQMGEMYSVGDASQLADKINLVLVNFLQYKKTAMDFVPQAIEKYQICYTYKELIDVIYQSSERVKNPIRHIDSLLILNERKSKLARLELKIRLKMQKIKFKFFRR